VTRRGGNAECLDHGGGDAAPPPPPVGEPAGAATLVALAFAKSGDGAATQNVWGMAVLPDWAARWLERQARVADSIARVAPFDRMPRRWLISLVHAAGLIALLSVGVFANSPFVWALVAIPMTMIVVLVLSGRARPARVSSPRRDRGRPFDVQAIGPSMVEPAFDSPIVVARRTQPSRMAEPLAVRRSR
jgi:hypothetical protein